MSGVNRAAAYVRVSTADQNSELQIRELRVCAERQGWQIAEVYEDVMSGANSSRSGLNHLIRGRRRKEI